jgi:hypothetical protein
MGAVFAGPLRERAGFPRVPPSLTMTAPQKRLGAAPAMSVAAPEIRMYAEAHH